MKKYIFIIFTLFVFLESVNADCKCVYKTEITTTYFFGIYSKTETLKGTIYVTDKPKINVGENFFGMDTTGILDSTLDKQWTNKKLAEMLKNKCQSSITLCKAEGVAIPGQGARQLSAIIINNTLMSNMKSFPYTFAYDKTAFIISDLNKCQEASLIDKESTCKGVKNNYNCEPFDQKLSDLKDLYCKEGTEGCNSYDINEYKKIKKELVKYCNSILLYQNSSNDCLSSCLTLSSEINSIESVDDNNINDCGLSNNIVNWIKNILKWIKYILPVLVIILGILDFIKAISSGSDDEMKKAQGRFVKRLIAAALLFIIPAIIEFVLTIFKIESTFCGIIGK